MRITGHYKYYILILLIETSSIFAMDLATLRKTTPHAQDWVEQTHDWCCDSFKIPRCCCCLLAAVCLGSAADAAFMLCRCGYMEREQARICMDETFSFKMTPVCAAVYVLGMGAIRWVGMGRKEARDEWIKQHAKVE